MIVGNVGDKVFHLLQYTDCSLMVLQRPRTVVDTDVPLSHSPRTPEKPNMNIVLEPEPK
jgi:hypothetical protein